MHKYISVHNFKYIHENKYFSETSDYVHVVHTRNPDGTLLYVKNVRALCYNIDLQNFFREPIIEFISLWTLQLLFMEIIACLSGMFGASQRYVAF